MKLHWLSGMAILAVVALSGCAESRAYKSYREEIDSWSYGKRFAIVWKDWALDAVDMASLEGGMGETIGIELQPTELLQMGVIFGDVMKFGFRDRSIGFYREVIKEGGLTWFYYRDRRFEPIIGTPSLFERPRLVQHFPIRDNSDWHWMDIGGELALVFFQGSAHASPKEALDFGISTLMLPCNLLVRPALHAMGADMPEIDICSDDTAAEIRKKHDLELIKQPPGFEPTETLNELERVPY